MVQRPRLPVLPTPVMPMPGSTQLPGSSPLIPGIRPPVLPRPLGAPGYMPSPAMAPMMAPPGAPSLPAQLNPIPRPPGSVATTVPGSTAAPTSSNGAPPMVEAMIVSMPTLKLLRLIISLDLLANEASQEILVVQLLCWDFHHLVQ
nr:u1 small nuclear ribonucleoprotein c [Quercus suber]